MNKYNKIDNYYDKHIVNQDIIKAYITNNSLDYENLASYMLSFLKILRNDKDNLLYIYNQNGLYEPLESWYLPSIYKEIVNSSGFPWEPKTESLVISALKRDCKITVDGFNNENAMNFQNGVFYLKTGQFVEHTPDNSLFTSILDYKYSPEADCPIFKKFINDTACNDEELILDFQEMMGYCLSNRTDAEKAFWLYGSGSNGKSVLGSVIHSLVGKEQTAAISLDSINDKFALSEFIDKKVNIAAENENLSNSERLKSLISCDRINLPVKYKPDWTGVLFTKHIFLMNSLPVTPDVTHGFMRKILIIPFNNSVKAEDMDRDLVKKLKKELSGIFNWAYQGYVRLVKNNFEFSKCQVIDDIMKEYKDRENPTGEFFNDNFEKDSKSKVKKSDIFKSYCEWSEKHGTVPMNKVKFYNALQIKANESDSDIVLDYRKRQGYVYLIGYKKKSDNDNKSV